MRFSEEALLLGVRSRLLAACADGGAGFTDRECDVELDEMAPATVGDLYVAVLPGGWAPGPRHRSSGGVNDLVYSVDVVVIKRVTAVPRDRRRDVFLNNLGSLTREIDRVYSAIDFKQEVIDAANAVLAQKEPDQQRFVEMLKFAGMDRRPRPAPAELFAASREPNAGILRVISFQGARRITTK